MTPHTLRHALNRAHYSTLEPGYRVNGSTPLSAVSCCIFFGCIAGACSLGQWAPAWSLADRRTAGLLPGGALKPGSDELTRPGGRADTLSFPSP